MNREPLSPVNHGRRDHEDIPVSSRDIKHCFSSLSSQVKTLPANFSLLLEEAIAFLDMACAKHLGELQAKLKGIMAVLQKIKSYHDQEDSRYNVCMADVKTPLQHFIDILKETVSIKEQVIA